MATIVKRIIELFFFALSLSSVAVLDQAVSKMRNNAEVTIKIGQMSIGKFNRSLVGTNESWARR